MFDLYQQCEIAAQPQFEKDDDAANHSFFSGCGRRKIDFDPVLQNVRIYPCENFLFGIEEDHVLVENEVAIDGGQADTSFNHSASVGEGFLVGIQLFEDGEALLFEIVVPDLL